ncbi:MAG: DJ-1/PfpI family protein [Myxococcales bacterium]|nr:DJ-1/PfpI family protein [Myxococcales bacterium]
MRGPTRIQIVVFDGFDELDAVGPFEVLRAAERAGAPLRTRWVAAEACERVEGGHGLRIGVDGVVDGECEWILVPGGAWTNPEVPGCGLEIRRGVLPRRLADLRARGLGMAAVCTGTMLLAAAGITRGRRAITHHVAIDALAASGAEVVRARVVDDGDLLTAGGVTSGLDLALHMVARFAGADAAAAGGVRMEYPSAPWAQGAE